MISQRWGNSTVFVYFGGGTRVSSVGEDFDLRTEVNHNATFQQMGQCITLQAFITINIQSENAGIAGIKYRIHCHDRVLGHWGVPDFEHHIRANPIVATSSAAPTIGPQRSSCFAIQYPWTIQHLWLQLGRMDHKPLAITTTRFEPQVQQAGDIGPPLFRGEYATICGTVSAAGHMQIEEHISDQHETD